MSLRLPLAILIAAAFSATSAALAEPPTAVPATCPSGIVSLITAARAAASSRNLVTAKLQYDELVNRADLPECSVDLQMKARREYGDVLAKLAARKTGAEQLDYKRLAADQYQKYLEAYTASGDSPDLLFPRVVLNAYANMTFETGAFDQLCDQLAALVASKAALFDANVIEKWWKCLEAATWNDATRTARRKEYCELFSQPSLMVSHGARAQYGSTCNTA